MKLFYSLYATLFGREFFQSFHRFLYGLSLRGMGVMNYYDFGVSGEEYVLRRIRKFRPKIGVFVDVGANEGDYSELVARVLCPEHIIAIEAHPETASRLEKRLDGLCRDLRVVRAAAIDDHSTETITLFDFTTTGSAHASVVTDQQELADQPVTELSVAATTIDDVIDREQLKHVDLLKLDIEGAEFSALTGAARLLNRGGVDYVQFEFNEMNIASGVRMRDFMATLHDYELYRILPRGLASIGKASTRIQEIYGFQNILAVRNGCPI